MPVRDAAGRRIRRARGSASWEVTLLRRPSARGRPRVMGRLLLDAPDAARARAAAADALASRSAQGGCWSLGVLRPLTPAAPGTRLYLVTFFAWEQGADGLERRVVHRSWLWATDAQSARRLAREEAQGLSGYRPAWRVRDVVPVAAPV